MLYQEYSAIISLSPTGRFVDLLTARSAHFFPVYAISSVQYEVVVRV